MNLSTALIALLCFVALGGVVVAQQVDMRTRRYQIGVNDRELRTTQETLRVLRVKLARERDPKKLYELAKSQGAPILAPEQKDPPPAPDKPVVQKSSKDSAKPNTPKSR